MWLKSDGKYDCDLKQYGEQSGELSGEKVMESKIAIWNLLVAVSVDTAAHVESVVKGNLKIIFTIIFPLVLTLSLKVLKRESENYLHQCQNFSFKAISHVQSVK